MGQNRVRPPKGGKAARWGKGQSSSSNPTKNKHRSAAKSRLLQQHTGTEGQGIGGLGPGKLTAAALMRHEALLSEQPTSSDGTPMATEDQEDAISLGMTKKTFDTFASDWTQCTNVAFDKILRKFQVQNAGHKETLAVLAAVTEVIKSQGGKETETEYFAALMSTLEVSNTVENLNAVVRLLSLVIKKIPKEILVNRYSQVCELLLDTLSKNADSQNVALIRSLLGCISVVLRVQPPGVWSLPEVQNIFQCILTYTTHTKPKIRKAGQHAIVAVVRGGEVAANGVHPAAAKAAEHCLTIIKGSGPSDNNILYMMLLLRELLPTLPKQLTKQCCETILKLLTLGSNNIVSTGFAALYGLFADRPTVGCLPADLNSQLVSAVYEYKPSVNDPSPTVAWLAVLQEGLINLSQQNKPLCHSHLYKFCSEVVSCWTSSKPEVVKSAGLAVRAVILETMDDVSQDICNKVIEELCLGLKYQYHAAWHVVMAVLAAVSQTTGRQHPQLLYPMLRQLSQLRNADNVGLEKEIDTVVGRAVAAMGPKHLLTALPLNITGNETNYEFKTSWIIPVMRDNISKTELSFFIQYLLPLASKCLERSIRCEEQKDTIGHKTYQVLNYQIWSLLPGFCTAPTDLTTSFKLIAKVLGTQLTARKEIRLDILTGLRNLINTSIEVEEQRNELAKYSKNFLPILFNLFTSKPAGSEEAGQRLASLETVKLFLKVSDRVLLASMFDKAIAKASENTVDIFTRDALQDLLRCLLAYIDQGRIKTLYTAALDKITSKDHKEQKKSYRLIEEICKCSTEDAKQFLSSSLPALQECLVSALSKTSPSSQAPRLHCLISITSSLKSPGYEFVFASVPEAILCIRAVNKKARDAAYALLVTIGEAIMRWEGDNRDEAVRKFLNQVMVGLAGTPTLINCTILAVSRIYYQFTDILPIDVIEQLLTNILLLLSSSSREVSSAGLSFIKVFITTTPLTIATRFLPKIIKAIVSMPDDCKRHARQKTKFLLERCSRKFGFDLVASLVPKSDVTTQKRLRNIRKELARRARKVSEDSGMEDGTDVELGMIKGRQKTMDELLADSSDEDDEEEENTPSGRRGKQQTGGAWIHEESGEIVDLLSSEANQKISSTRPSKAAASVADDGSRKKAAAKKKSDFKMTADGKIIITEKSGKYDENDDDDDNEDSTVAGKESTMDQDMSDEGEETFESLVTKRKISSEAGSMKSSISRRTDAKKYKPGGSGIHRKLDTPGSEYKSNKGRGDVKKKGKPDPFAYIPLNHKTLNKRKAVKSHGVFSKVVKAAKKGANKGNKYKVKEVKKMMESMKV